MGRPAVVPPAGRGEGGWMRAPVGALGEKVGRFFPKAPREVRPARRSEPYLGDAEGGVDREDSIPSGRWAAPVGREGGSGWGTRPSG